MTSETSKPGMTARCAPASACRSTPRFRLVRTILLDEQDTAISMLPGALLSGYVTRADPRTWPLFDRLRGTVEFD